MSNFTGHSIRRRKGMRRQSVKRPIKISMVGDADIARQFIGSAKKQMDILRNEMGFQGMKQGVRRVNISNEISVECIKKFDNEFCRIIYEEPTVEREEESLDTDRLLIVAGDQERMIRLTGVAGSFQAGESVICGDDGYGTITFVSEIGSGSTQTIYGSFVHCYTGVLEGESSLAKGNINECKRRYFERLYEHSEIYKKPPQQLIVEDPKSYFYITSALDATNPSNIACTDITTLIDKEWSKTHGKFMVSVFTYTIFGIPFTTFWAASASYDGKTLTWNGGLPNYPAVGAGGFQRTVYPNLGSMTNPVQTHIGFDIWQDDDGGYHAGLISDQGATLYVFSLDKANSDMTLDHQYNSTVRNDFFPDENYPTISDYGTKYVRLLGYGYVQSNDEHVAYWAALGRDPFYYSEVLNGGDITEHSMADSESIDGGAISSAIWNPIKRQVYFMFESDAGETEISGTFEFTYWFVKTCVTHPAAGYACCWDEDGVYVPPGSWSCESEGIQISPKTDCQLRLEVDGVYHFYDAFCTEYPDGHDNLDFCYSYWAGTLKNPTSETYMGLFKVDADDYPKGKQKHFSIEDCSVSTSAPAYPASGVNCCNTNGGFQVVDTTYNRSECEPESVYRYQFDKWVFANDDQGHAYQYQEDTMEQVEDSGSDDLVCAWKDNFGVKKSGNSSLLKAASGTFPYDDSWTAVLLSGTDSYSNKHEGWVVYRDLVGGGFFAVSDDGTEHSIGDFDRSFFFNLVETMEGV